MLLTHPTPAPCTHHREWRKKVHWSLHTAAAVCILFGLTAAFQSHNLKRPVPIPNLYSPHSLLGLTTVLMATLQFCVGLGCYLAPKAPLHHRVALGPVHRFMGQATWLCGLASIAVGVWPTICHVFGNRG